MKNIRKLFSFLFILFVISGFFSQGNKCAAANNGNFSADTSTEKKHRGCWDGKLKTVSPGKLTVATCPDFAPYEFYITDKEGNAKLAGFEMSLAKYIANYVGLSLDIVTVDFDATMTELQTRSVDLGMSGYTPKPERKSIMDFSDIFYVGGQSFVCLQKNKRLFPSLEATNKSRYSIGAQTGSVQLDLARKHSPNSNIVSLPKATDVIADLLAGNLDGAYIETVIAESYKKNYSKLEIALPVPYEHEGSVIGVSKGNELLLAAVNEAIAAAISDGSMEKFIAEAVEQISNASNKPKKTPEDSQTKSSAE